MFPYLFIVFLLLLLNYGKIDSFELKTFRFLILIYIALFMCGGYMCGSDWRNYEYYYYNTEESLMEPGLFVLASIFKTVGLGFWEFNIFIKFICLLTVFQIVKKYSTNGKYLALLLFFSFYGIYLFIDAPLRNLCAIAIFMLSILIYDKHPRIAIVLPAIGIIFHSSSIIAYLFYALKFIDDRYKIKTWIFVSVYIIAVALSFQGTWFVNWIDGTFLGQLFFAEKLDRYVTNGFDQGSMKSSAASLGELLRIIFFFIVVCNRRKLEKRENGRVIFLGSMLFFILSKIAASAIVLMRFACYYSVFYAIVMCALIYVVRYRQIYKATYILYSIVITCSTLKTDYRFVPYTNYISYVLFHDQLPTYTDRSNYNFKYSPYKK